MIQNYLIAAGLGFLVGVIIVGLPAIILAKAKTGAFEKVSAAYERIINMADARVATSDKRLSDFMDRRYVEKNLPPGGIDLAAEHQERRKAEKEKVIERRNGRALAPSVPRIGAVDEAQSAMEEKVRRDRKEA